MAAAAKASCIRAERIGDVRVTIFERAAIGAHWDGAHGYTDGRQPLCTPAERDLGFPYDVDSFGQRVAERMQARFSWPSYLIREDGDHGYADWISRGAQPPSAQIRRNGDSLERAMQRDLSFDLDAVRGLHAPLLSGVVGPGFTSLMSLGRMADRILAPYVETSRQ